MFPQLIAPRMRGLSGLYRGPTGVGQFFRPMDSYLSGLPSQTAAVTASPSLLLVARNGSLSSAAIAVGADSRAAVIVYGSSNTGLSFGLQVNAGTNVSDNAVQIANRTGGTNFFWIYGDGHGFLGPTGSLGLSWTTAGNVAVAAPTSGFALVVNNASAQPGIEISAASGFADGRAAMRFLASKTTVQTWDIGIDTGGGTAKSFEFRDITRNAIPVLINITGNVVIAAPTTGAALSLPAGTTAVYPLLLNSGVALTTPVAGAVEFDGTAKYFTPAASSRAVASNEYVCVMNGTKTLVSQTAAQAIFNSTTNGAVTLPIGTYIFECQFQLTAMSTVTGGFGFALGGAATFTQGWSSLAVNAAAVTATNAQMTYDTAANTAIGTATTAGVAHAMIKGIIRVTVAGTVIPQVSLITAAAAVVSINSYFKCYPVGNGTATTVGNWS